MEVDRKGATDVGSLFQDGHQWWCDTNSSQHCKGPRAKGECNCPSARYCDVCDRPEDDLCDDCAADERERDLERAERLAEEDRFLYGI